ncbi:hypothetical protein FSP39_010341 [Pinctada imbricata]|uniref:CCHC-type domain-containing protein n=1 Tax=Pinctada imbricata TaxID=66713 RepID=A0AA88XHK5_PINIB|nr:hypothetical protein FSP39_010341 [Pinctada imbricata]
MDPYHISWTALRSKFYEQYVSMNLGTNTSIYAESVAFNNLTLGTSSLDDFHCTVVQKGKKLQKTPLDIMCKFIDGLPKALQYFVRAGRPSSIDDALQSAKMGETVGYRDDQPSINAFSAVKDDVVSKLESQIQALTHKLDTLTTTVASNQRMPQKQESRTLTCYSCGGKGHAKSVCNWAGKKDAQPDISCQIFAQNGHSADDCYQYVPVSVNRQGRGGGRGRPPRSQ